MDGCRERLEARRPAGRLPRSSRQEMTEPPFPVSRQGGWSERERDVGDTAASGWRGGGGGEEGEEANMIHSSEPGEAASETI